MNVTKCKYYHEYYVINEGGHHQCKLHKWDSTLLKCPSNCKDFQMKKSAIKELCKEVFMYIGTHLLETSVGNTFFDIKDINKLVEHSDFNSLDDLFKTGYIWFTHLLGNKGMVMYRLIHSRKVITHFQKHLTIKPNIHNLDYTEQEFGVKWYDHHPEKVINQKMDYRFFLAMVNKQIPKLEICKIMGISKKQYELLYKEAEANNHLNFNNKKYYHRSRKLWKVVKFIDGKDIFFGAYSNEWEAMMVVEELKKVDWDKSKLREIQNRVEEYFKDKDYGDIKI